MTPFRFLAAAAVLVLLVACATVPNQLAAAGAGGLLHPARRHLTTAMPPSCVDATFAADGVELNGWRCRGSLPHRGTVVYLHGVADNRSSSVGVIERFGKRGFDVIAYDSRAHGESPGDFCTYGFFEKRDLHNVIDGIGAGPIILFGTSLGAAVALQEAALDSRITAVVAAETFSDIRTVATERAPFFFTPKIIDRSFRIAEEQAHFDAREVSPVTAATAIKIPVLLLHGANDTDTPPDHSRRVFAALGGPKHLILVPGARHNESLRADVWSEIERWLDDVLETRGEHGKDVKWLHAIDLILTAFQTRPLVALSEGAGHGQTETREFFNALIHDSRFSSTVNSVVIEFGNARYQATIDRYVSGNPVAREELRHVWEDTTQVSGVWSLPMYEQMLTDVRSVNARLPAARRIRILLGDPPIDWTTVISPADEDMNDWRDAHFAQVVDVEVMRRQEKALILIGGAHISRGVVFPNSLIHLLDARFPGQTLVVGVLDSTRVDPDIKSRLQPEILPAGATVRHTWLGRADVRQIGFTLSHGVVEDDVDALLLLPSASALEPQPAMIDSAYKIELARRQALGYATLPFRGAKIRFEEGRAAFASDADEPLDAILREMRRDRGLRLSVKAFSDRTEVDAAALSTRRAELVVEWLASRGITRSRLVPEGCGSRRPLTFGNTADERAMNRRAELVRFTDKAGCEPPW